VGRALVAASRAHAAARGAGEVLFVSDTTAESGRAFATALGAQLSFAEHRMDLDPAAVPAAPSPMPDLDIRPARADDAPGIVAVLVAAFGDPPAMVERFVAERIASRAHRFLLGELAGRPAGTLRLIAEDGWAYVSTFGVLPTLHGRGVGRRMLLHAIAQLLAEGQRAVRIEVETTNAPAIRLYESCGFHQDRTYAYHTLPEPAL
jgi:ribosomal protein S18 acetylase RimI-like enzyme